jgi:hypothetical protein
MNGQLKLLFDENMSRPLVEALAVFLSRSPHPTHVEHYLQQFPSGASDQDWIPAAKNNGFCIVSADRGKRYGGDKLPLICRDCGVTHILYSRSAEVLRQWEKLRGVVVVWPRLIQLVDSEPPGTRLNIRYIHDTFEVYAHKTRGR